MCGVREYRDIRTGCQYSHTQRCTQLNSAEIAAEQAKIGEPGFEPGASRSQTVRATKLRHSPEESMLCGFIHTNNRLIIQHTANKEWNADLSHCRIIQDDESRLCCHWDLPARELGGSAGRMRVRSPSANDVAAAVSPRQFRTIVRDAG